MLRCSIGLLALLCCTVTFRAEDRAADQTRLLTALRDARTLEEGKLALTRDGKSVDVAFLQRMALPLEAMLGAARFDVAERFVQLQADAAELVGTPAARGLAHLGRGMLLEATGKSAPAEAAYEKGQTELRKANFAGAEALLCVNRVWPLLTPGHGEEALKQANRGVELALKQKLDTLLPRAMANRAWALRMHGDLIEAEKQYLAALARMPADGDPLLLGRTHFGLGESRFQRGQLEKAREAFLEAMRLATLPEIRDGDLLANALNGHGMTRMEEGAYDAALEDLDLSEKLFGSMNNLTMRARVDQNRALIHLHRGELTEAEKRFRELLQAARSLGDGVMMIATLENLGEVYRQRGKYADAILTMTAALGLARESRDSLAEVRSLNNLGMAYADLGNPVKAMLYFGEAVELAGTEKVRATAMQATALNNLATLEMSLGENENARRKFEKCLVLAKDTHKLRQHALLNLAVLDHREGHPGAALKRLQEGCERTLATGERGMEGAFRRRLGYVLLDLDKPTEAAEEFRKAGVLAEATGNLADAVEADKGRAEVYYRTGQWKAAVRAYQQAVTGIETLRTNTLERTLQTSLQSTHDQTYRHLALCLQRVGETADAFVAAERGKARTLIDILDNGRVPLSARIPPEQQRIEEDLREKLARAESQLRQASARGSDDDRKQARAELLLARTNLEQCQQGLYLAHPVTQVNRARFSPATLNEIGKTLFKEEPGLALLSYHVGREETLLFVLTLAQDTTEPRLDCFTIPVRREQLVTLVRQFRHRCANKLAYEDEARDLFRLLVKPAADRLAGRTHLGICPDETLHLLPFQALLDEQGKHLVERVPIFYAPSVTALVKMIILGNARDGSPLPRQTALVLGRPIMPVEGLSDLEHTEREARDIARQFGVKPWLGALAGKTRLLSEIESASYVHIASHGRVSDRFPLSAQIALSKGDRDDGLLSARELLDLQLKTRLVVLSACDTASRGATGGGEGLLGLGWALFAAGSPANLLTLWAINDASTADLMQEFYKQFAPRPADRRGAICRDEALRLAQIRLLKKEETKHPRYWAPFVLIGDWRK